MKITKTEPPFELFTLLRTGVWCNTSKIEFIDFSAYSPVVPFRSEDLFNPNGEVGVSLKWLKWLGVYLQLLRVRMCTSTGSQLHVEVSLLVLK